MTRRRAGPALSLVLSFLLLLILSPGAYAAVSVTRAELSDGRLRVEGRGARAGATITVNTVAMGTAASDGSFRVERSGFSSATCRIAVNDGTSPVEVVLSGCSPTASTTPKPHFSLRTEVGAAGQPLRFQAAADGGIDLAFSFAWGDGTTLRDPPTGFHAPNDTGTRVEGAEVTHTWNTPGTYTATVTALDRNGGSARSDPVTITITESVDATQNDCGAAGDAGNDLASARAVTLPLSCSGLLQGNNGIDNTDVYSFDVAQEFRLLTVRTTGGVSFELFDPTGETDSFGRPVPEPIPSFYFGQAETKVGSWTLQEAGTWKIRVIGGDTSYTLSLQSDLGGDDCATGRNANFITPRPVDAPNNSASIAIGNEGEVDCTGKLVFTGRDRFDTYIVAADNELVAWTITTSMPEPPCQRRVILGASDILPHQFACLMELFELGPRSTLRFAIQASWPNDVDHDYRIQLATSHRRNGDCFTGADAGNTFATAAPLSPACLGEIGPADPEDWYSFQGATGDELHLTKRPGVPLEVYDPDGIKRADNSGSIVIDRTGLWRIRTLTDKTGFAHFEGVYGLRHFFRRGIETRDCDTGADTGAGGLDVTLPISCRGDFVPFTTNPVGPGADTSDRYNFTLARGETVEATVASLGPENQWTASIDTPSSPRVVSHMFANSPRTFTYTATETGKHSLFLERSPGTNGFDLRYSVAISKQAAPSRPVLAVGLNTPEVVRRGDTFSIEGTAFNSGGAATSVSLTLSASPSDAIRIEQPKNTATVNIGSISSPGQGSFRWTVRAERGGSVRLTLTARDGPTGVTATGSRTINVTG